MTSTSHPLVWTKRPAAAPTAPLLAVAGEAAQVDVFPSLAEARRDWLDLQAAACASPYQSFAFAEAWFETVGLASGIEPFIVVAKDASGLPSALLPLARRRLGPLALAIFPGGRDSNFNLGLFRPGRLWGAGEVRSLLRQRAPLRPASIASRCSTSRGCGRASGIP
jgi:CelD/BcsL family acetyltransferase involved in cellulose biosynthesis